MNSVDDQSPQSSPLGSNGANASTASGAPPAQPSKGMRKGWLYAVLALAFLFVLMPYLFWQATWFGKPLNDDQMARAFSDTDHPRESQHALSQLADRMLSPEANVRASARKWYPKVIEMSQSPDEEIRLTAAWVMQQDNTVPEFHTALTHLLADNNTMVARNAALALVRFDDPAGHDVIVSMLKPAPLVASAGGKLVERASPGDAVTAGNLLGKVESDGASLDVRATVPGKFAGWNVAEGSLVSENEVVASINPSPEMVWEALRALYIIGTPADEAVVEPYTHGEKGMPPQTAQQATQTLDAIKSRASASQNRPPAH
jgi:hypothetical protein